MERTFCSSTSTAFSGGWPWSCSRSAKARKILFVLLQKTYVSSKTATYLVWEKIQFQDDAHFAQFFRISGYSKKGDVDAELKKNLKKENEEEMK